MDSILPKALPNQYSLQTPIKTQSLWNRFDSCIGEGTNYQTPTTLLSQLNVIHHGSESQSPEGETLFTTHNNNSIYDMISHDKQQREEGYNDDLHSSWHRNCPQEHLSMSTQRDATEHPQESPNNSCIPSFVGSFSPKPLNGFLTSSLLCRDLISDNCDVNEAEKGASGLDFSANLSEQDLHLNRSTQVKKFDHDISNIRFNIRRPESPKINKPPQTDGPKPKDPKTKTNEVQSPNRKTSKSSTVLYVKGVNPEKVSVQELCNLFSNYGNVEMGVMHKDKDFALIKYTTVQGAEMGLEQLDKVRILGFRMSIFFSKYEKIMEKRYLNNKEYYIPDPNHRRFKKDVPTQVNPISRTLHLCVFQSNPRKIISDKNILNFVSNYAECSRIRRDINTTQKNMWFAEFKSRASAIYVLMKLHDAYYEDGNVRVSFTRTKKGQP